MKYIDSEKLIAGLTKMQFSLNAAYRKPQADNIVRAISLEYDDIISFISFITSLQQEQPEVDLEKELRNWMVKMDGKYALLTTNYVDQLITDTAKHFYELGLKARKEK